MLSSFHVEDAARWVALVSLLLSAPLWTACDDVSCPPNTEEVDERCVERRTDESVAGSSGGGANPDLTGTMTMGVSTAGTVAARPPSVAGEVAQAMSMAPPQSTPGPASAGNGALLPVAGAPARAAAGAGGISGTESAGPEACTTPNQLRCEAGGSGKRSQCLNGSWTPISGCSPTDVCAGPETTAPGACLAVAMVCGGVAGGRACDGSGILYQCDMNEVIESKMQCGSADLCMPGIQTGRCATCAPGAFRCTGATLEQCGATGEAFIPSQTCASPVLCSEQTGACKAPACMPGEKMCMGDDLVQCNSQQDGFQKMQSCGRGLCNASRGACNVCSPSALPSCDGNTKVACASDGSMQIETPCPMVCSLGQCVACKTGDQRECKAQCGAGTQTCLAGIWGSCVGERSPGPREIKCDNIDNDCNTNTPDTCGSGLQCRSSGGSTTCLPPGSYLDSCTGCSVSGGTVSCTCSNMGTSTPTSASINCPSGLWQ
jgi:hypothetical protein